MLNWSKWVVLIALIVLGRATFASDKSSGCGLGWQVFKKNSLVSSSLRATTNAFALNTIAMTLGTSGCAKHSIVKNDKKSLHFLESNLPMVQMEMAMGNGEYINGLAQTFGCDEAAFSGHMQGKYNQIFNGEQDRAINVLVAIEAEIVTNPHMLKACGII